MSPRANSSGRTYGGETQAERKARRREQFIEAGLEVFGTVGYRQATVRQLCREAQLTDRYFYAEFGSAEDLLIAVYLQCIERIRRRVLDGLSLPPTEPVQAVIRDTLDRFFQSIEDPRLGRVVWFEVLSVSPRVDRVYMDAVCGFADLLMHSALTVHPGLGAGPKLHRMTAVSLIGALSEAAKHWLMGDYAEPRAAMVDATEPVFLGMAQYLGHSIVDAPRQAE